MQGNPSGPSKGGRVDTRMEGCHHPQRSQAFQQSWTNRAVGVIKWIQLLYTLWLFNIAMENGQFIDDFPIKTSIY